MASSSSLVRAVAPDSIDRVESVEEVLALPHTDEPVALLAQTTLSHRDWEGVAVAVKERFPDVWMPGRSDLCFATTNRQAAIEELAHRSDAIVVIEYTDDGFADACSSVGGSVSVVRRDLFVTTPESNTYVYDEC